MLGQCCSV